MTKGLVGMVLLTLAKTASMFMIVDQMCFLNILFSVSNAVDLFGGFFCCCFVFLFFFVWGEGVLGWFFFWGGVTVY